LKLNSPDVNNILSPDFFIAVDALNYAARHEDEGGREIKLHAFLTWQ
jgi:hypothetical protein